MSWVGRCSHPADGGYRIATASHISDDESLAAHVRAHHDSYSDDSCEISPRSARGGVSCGDGWNDGVGVCALIGDLEIDYVCAYDSQKSVAFHAQVPSQSLPKP